MINWHRLFGLILAEAGHNSPLLFSAIPEIVRFGAEHFERHSTESSTLINDLFSHYHVEGIDMPYTMADYRRELREEVLSELTPEELRKHLPPEERMKDLSVDEILASLPEPVMRELRRRMQQEFESRSNGGNGH